MKQFFLFISFICIVQFSFAQDTSRTHYKHQFGLDLSSLVLSMSEASYGLFTTNAALYRRAMTPKDYLSLKIVSQSFGSTSSTGDANVFFTPDSNRVINQMRATSNFQLVLNYSRKLERQYLNFYGGVTTAFMIQNANVNTFEVEGLDAPFGFGFDTEILFNENQAFNFYRIGIAPSAGIEVKVGKRLSILTNINPMIYVSLGSWTFKDGNYNTGRRSLTGDILLDTTLLRDISLMLHF